MPHIISESGRALTAHHALLLINVIDVESQVEPVPPELARGRPPAAAGDGGEPRGADARTGSRRCSTTRSSPRSGPRSTSPAASSRCGSGATPSSSTWRRSTRCQQRDRARTGRRSRRSSAHIDATLVDRYFCNFSVFQSLPDNWAIDQLFPIMPIHRLQRGADPARHPAGHDLRLRREDRPLRRRAQGRSRRSSCTRSREGEPYILGIFLTGAYQEILGDLHNLFGDTNAVHVRLTEQGYEITDLVHGDTVTEVLNYVQFHASRPAGDLPAQGERNAKDLSRQEANTLHRGLRGGAGGVYVPGGGCAGGSRGGRTGGDRSSRGSVSDEGSSHRGLR